MILNNLGDVRTQLERGCELLKKDGGFRTVDWMISVGALYRNCLTSVRKVEQNGSKPSFFNEVCQIFFAARFLRPPHDEESVACIVDGTFFLLSRARVF